MALCTLLPSKYDWLDKKSVCYRTNNYRDEFAWTCSGKNIDMLQIIVLTKNTKIPHFIKPFLAECNQCELNDNIIYHHKSLKNGLFYDGYLIPSIINDEFHNIHHFLENDTKLVCGFVLTGASSIKYGRSCERENGFKYPFFSHNNQGQPILKWTKFHPSKFMDYILNNTETTIL